MKTADCRTYLVGLPLTWGRVDVHASFASADGLVYKVYVRVTPASTGHNEDLFVGLTPASTGYHEIRLVRSQFGTGKPVPYEDPFV